VITGFWYAIKRQNQSAADVAALSSAFELLAGKLRPASSNVTSPVRSNGAAIFGAGRELRYRYDKLMSARVERYGKSRSRTEFDQSGQDSLG
jgi:uncharacterized membrane protein